MEIWNGMSTPTRSPSSSRRLASKKFGTPIGFAGSLIV
jgi:hypothetical protein